MSNELSTPVSDKRQSIEHPANTEMTSSKLLNDVRMDNFRMVAGSNQSLEGFPGISIVDSKERDPQAEAESKSRSTEEKKEKPVKEGDPGALEVKPSENKKLSFTPDGDVLNINAELCESGKKLVTGDCFTKSSGKSDHQDQILETPSGDQLVVRRSKFGDKTISGFIMIDKEGKVAKPDGTLEVEGKTVTTYDNGAYSYTENGITTIIFKDGARAQVVDGKIIKVNRPQHLN